MIPRICDLPLNRSFFLFGPRQTGKSTLVNSTFTKKVWKINLLMTDQFLKYSKHPERLRLEALEKIEREGIRRIFIDEIQRVPDLLNEVHFLIEKTGCQFLMTGSSARKLRKGGINLLAGRAVQRRLFPFVYQEIGDSFSLDEVLRFGSLPAIYDCSLEDRVDILNSYTETYLREEIHAEGLVRNLGGFSRLLDLAASQCGELISFTSISRDCHVATRTVQAYYDILEDTLISIRLQPWRKSIRKRMVSHAKFYLFDLGITNSLIRQLTAPPDPVRRGRLFEQFIILETYRLLRYRQSEACIYFWRTNHGAEVDLIIEKYGKIIGAFEIKSQSHITGAHLSGLRSFRSEYPDVPLHVIAMVENPYRIEDILIVSWKIYLEELLEKFL
ncbi:MAG: ATP-binding protein [Deltaproteobacteria bacterium]|nr:ATP-binding protein [Deltaproteobacteria bacterium]MBW1795788.1 ATP-binding protein [Deltaproteobacteria bacterium]